MYLPLLWLAAREIGHETLHDAHDAHEHRTDRRRALRAGHAGPVAGLPRQRGAGTCCATKSSRSTSSTTSGLSGSEFRKSCNFEKTSEGFTYGAERTAAGARTRDLRLHHRRGVACDELAALRLRTRDQSAACADRRPGALPRHAHAEQHHAQERAADPLVGRNRRTRGAVPPAGGFRRSSTRRDSTPGSSRTSRRRGP